MARLGIVLGLIAAAVWGGACSTPPVASRSGEVAVDPVVPSASELAARHLEAVAGLESLVVTSRLRHGGGVVLSRAWMTPERMRLEVRENGTRIFAMGIAEGRQREWAPRADLRDDPMTGVMLEYDAKLPGGHGNVFLVSSGVGCLFGDVISNWLSEERRSPGMAAEAMGAGVVEGIAVVRGRPCFVCRRTRSEGKPGTPGFYEFEQEFAVDVSSGLIRRWIGVQRTGARPDVVRRVYDYEYAMDRIDPAVFEAGLEEAVWDGVWESAWDGEEGVREG